MIFPVLLCGGSGTRLWPLSRKSYPKQFTDVIGDDSLFQASAKRFCGEGFAAPLVITGDPFRFIVTEQLDEIGVTPAGILIEPEGRNTAPAACAAALFAIAQDPEATILLVPSDHAIPQPELFRETVMMGNAAASRGQIVTFGIAPSRAETGYGWLETGDCDDGIYRLERFIEKPDQARAEELFADGRYLWNAGVFLTKARVLLEAFKTHAPDMLDQVHKAMEAAKGDLSFTRIDPPLWAGVEDESIDFAVMEKAGNLSAVRYDGHWTDLGGWESVWLESEKDGNGNAITGAATALDCHDSLLRAEAPDQELVGIGLKNIVAVAMRDAVMVADMSSSQNVKQAVKVLKGREAKQALEFPVDRRPWGWYETLALSDRFQVKRIHVNPGAALSLQSHHHRSEHWIVVQGTAKVTVDEEVKLITENQSVYIPLGAVHRMENPGKLPMVLIEVQTGSYLGEDDIVRYEDIYART
ncbi:mannose-1-phosphate guanylyltransferase/mannose-1-phosphate guanylyltransferase/mannose-6-phosphate isomerase [Sagittula marina]|uniref:mannose-1-phosphate guanylyltransferase n=1 Tax=Sagittula marina TaxID=943940 RepID=A0A7W6DSK1_9RHOB|nr:mannose-1-phosphate guanylyltransferase/mannose-6-phosphate isomerase [Sagittula marina]MBB3988420.1 mannose-1-phosphate guanylyltransferase/mannose-1-phosphate guanylyltransferase/mannose-6-phosphate isomerase [Sagittula marina]